MHNYDCHAAGFGGSLVYFLCRSDKYVGDTLEGHLYGVPQTHSVLLGEETLEMPNLTRELLQEPPKI